MKQLNITKHTVIILILTTLTATTSAALVEYDIENTNAISQSYGSEIVQAINLAAGVSSNGILYYGNGSCLRYSGYGTVYTYMGWSNTLAQGRNDSQYFAWDITVAEGYSYELDSLEFSILRGSYLSGAGHGSDHWDLIASTTSTFENGTTYDLGTIDISATEMDEVYNVGIEYSGNTADNSQAAISLTQFGTLNNESLYFRMYGYGVVPNGENDYSGFVYDDSAGGDFIGIGDNMVINEVIPEPAGMSLLLLGGMTLLKRRK